MRDRAISISRDMWPVLLVTLVVSLAFTVLASIFDQYHQISAEEVTVSEHSAVAAGQTQAVTIQGWQVTMHMPFGPDMPLLRYALEGPDSVGLSTTSLEKYGAACMASQDSVGSIVRMPASSLSSEVRPGQNSMVLSTIGDYAYVFEVTSGPCQRVIGAAAGASYAQMAIEGAASLTAAGN